MKMTITRALVQLKLLDKRIKKAIREDCFITYRIGNEPPKDTCDPKANLQSIGDLIKRRDQIKAKIMQSNSITTVTINDELMTVAEAIERKNSIVYQQKLLRHLRRNFLEMKNTVEQLNSEAQIRLDKMLEVQFGREKKTDLKELTTVSDSFWKANKAELIDPANIEEKMKELDEYIDGFLSEVDLVLSESNARTEIEIEI